MSKINIEINEEARAIYIYGYNPTDSGINKLIVGDNVFHLNDYSVSTVNTANNKKSRIQVNDIFSFMDYKGKELKFIIKGAWDGANPNNSHAWLMRDDFKGHTYAGKVTKVKDVWNISEKEFSDMCAGQPQRFTKEDS